MPADMDVLMSDRRSQMGMFQNQSAPRLCDCAPSALRSRHYSRRTDQSWCYPGRPKQEFGCIWIGRLAHT